MMLQGFVAGPRGSGRGEDAGVDPRAGCAAKRSRQPRAEHPDPQPRRTSDAGEERCLRPRSGRHRRRGANFALALQKSFSL